MPFELQPGEMVLFPAPFLPTERHLLIITNKRVVQYAPEGPYAVAEFELAKVDFIGRMSERPFLVIAIVLAALGLLLLIVSAVKVLPPTLYAGAAKSDKPEVEETADGRLVEGKDNQDEFPFFDKEIESRSMQNKANKLMKLKDIKPGLPPFNTDVKIGLVALLLAAGLLGTAYVLRKKEEFWIFCRFGENVAKIPARDAMHQNVVLQTMQAAQASAPKS